MKTEYIAIIIMIIISLALLYYGFVNFIKTKNINKLEFESSIDIPQLIDALGGKENINEINASLSKVNVRLLDNSVVKFDVIKALGASGIVENNESLILIFGKQSPLIVEDIQKYS